MINFDFSTILFIASLFTGGIWFIDNKWWLPGRQKKAAKTEPGSAASQSALRESTFVEYCKSFFPVIVAVFLLRSFLVEPFRIPSGSMMPTLLAGDFILVNKYNYGVRLPVINKKIIEIGNPKRGDAVVFRYPKQPSVDYIKRIVGLPGDRVRYKGKDLFINGSRVAQIPAGIYIKSGAGQSMAGASLRKEKLGDIEHDILVDPRALGKTGEMVVPEGHYFVMGDNRDNSNDSRYWGTVPNENLVGRAFMIWMHWDAIDNRINWSRIGDAIR